MTAGLISSRISCKFRPPGSAGFNLRLFAGIPGRLGR
jgi:hypothetical protein